MKKALLVLLLVFALLLPLLSACNTDNSESQADSVASTDNSDSTSSESTVEKEVVLRFAAMSDVHLSGSSTQTEYKRFEQALDFIYSYSAEQEYKNFDLLLVAGDMTNNGYENQLNSFAEVVTNKLQESTKKLFIMGNHEYYNNDSKADAKARWETVTGESANTHIVVNGYHFIGVSMDNENLDYASSLTWLDEELAKAVADAPDKPIFVTQHPHITNTVYGSDAWGTTNLTAVLKKYPQVVDFSGHSHYPVNDPRSINQKDFTSLGTGTLSYFELESGMVYGTLPPNKEKAAQFYVVEVYSDNSIDFKPYDLITSQFFPNIYSIENPTSTDTFVYTDARYQTADKPVFTEGTTLDISNIKDSSCTLSFKQATDGENLHSYRFDFYLASDNTKKLSFKIWSEFYFLDMPETMSYTATGLTSGTEYKVTVTAIDSYGKESDTAIEATFKTTGEPPAPLDPNAPVPDADMLDIVFDENGASDAGDLNKTVENFNAVIEKDSELNDAYVAKFKGQGDYLRIKFSADEYANYTEKLTIAAKIKINEFGSSYMDAFANMQSGGYGFEITANGQIEFWISIGGNYTTISTDIEKGKYYSLVGTYDGKTVKLYVDGELAALKDANGLITYPAEAGAHAFCVGSDINSGGTGDSFFNGNVAYARVYSVVLTDEQILSLGNK
ncbi:MAG: hypothetical protein A2Y17_03275 [Clostridiales bacterium GWF2_38_85]|nr:MAG: hypothetical protein A2Y17_03275 [Clostridiales bacterium GWF2_38_85]HBL85229.1 hypothetical protein [Clostridiales bacterium]